MSQTLLIGFGHKARHGKDTAANHLAEVLKGKYDARRYAFGNPLKIEFYDALSNPLHEYWGGVGHSHGSIGYLLLPHPLNPFASADEKLAWIGAHKTELGNHLQIYGTDYRRRQSPFYWVNITRQHIEADKPQIAILSDLRFKTEFYYLKAFGGFTIKVVREGFEVNDGRSPQHVSETELDNAKWDFEMHIPDGAVDELKRDTSAVFEMIEEAVSVKPLEGIPTVEVAA